MATAAKLTFEDFRRIQNEADECVRDELDEGELVLTPSPTPRHSLVSFRLSCALASFAQKFFVGFVTGGIDFRLSSNVVRKPDVAFIATECLGYFDLDRSPIELHTPPTDDVKLAT